ncbi:MAG: prepilin-type N-terminal cleavage/methylation domain-containing protein, partial [Rickettsiales bacterium]|nr:prepilin-type N-terminal cleavage/methylation domain-containing protein [Rickettsiales bacterium]
MNVIIKNQKKKKNDYRLKLYNYHYNDSYNTNSNSNIYKAFSLIELSIVLIIMGLLVAGITGGAALIKSAQLRVLITEFQNYRVAF